MRNYSIVKTEVAFLTPRAQLGRGRRSIRPPEKHTPRAAEADWSAVRENPAPFLGGAGEF